MQISFFTYSLHKYRDNNFTFVNVTPDINIPLYTPHVSIVDYFVTNAAYYGLEGKKYGFLVLIMSFSQCMIVARSKSFSFKV